MIKKQAFKNNNQIKYLVLPTSVEEIDDDSFSDLYNLLKL